MLVYSWEARGPGPTAPPPFIRPWSDKENNVVVCFNYTILQSQNAVSVHLSNRLSRCYTACVLALQAEYISSVIIKATW